MNVCLSKPASSLPYAIILYFVSISRVKALKEVKTLIPTSEDYPLALSGLRPSPDSGWK